MPVSELRLIKRCIEFQDRDRVRDIPHQMRGLYVLYNAHQKPGVSEKKWRFDVVYIGIAHGEKVGGVHGRIREHLTNKKKSDQWTHFSIYAVWDNIRGDELRELEGLFRHIYRKDPHANRLNIARSFQKLKDVSVKKLADMKPAAST